LPASRDDLLTIDLFEDPLKVVLPPTHRLARPGRPVALSDLSEERSIAGCPRCELVLRRGLRSNPAVSAAVEALFAVRR
jgi:DNA-binding transcriptional LysR family regulator